MGATGESVRRLTDGGFNPAWAPGGTALIYATEGVANPFGRTDTSALWRVDLATGSKVKVFDGDAVQPSVSPDGRHIAFWGLPPGTGRRVIYTIPAAGGTPTVVVDDHAYNWSPKWSPDGTTIYFASNRQRPMGIWRIPIDSATGRPAGAPTLVASGTEDYLGLSDAAAGAFVLPSTTSTALVERLPIDARAAKLLGPPTTLLKTARDISYVAPSPDGQFLAMTVNDATEDIVVSKTDGSGMTRLTNDAARDRGATWTPDSSRLYFFSDRSGHYEIWTIRRDGSSLQQVTHRTEETPLTQPHLSPDGRTLSVNVPGKVGLLDVSPLDAERPIQWLDLPPALAFFVVGWSPDGRALAGNAMGQPSAIVYSTTTKMAATVLRLAPFAMLDDHTLVGQATDNPHMIVADTRTGATRTGDSLPDDLRGSPVLSPDGRWIYLTISQGVAHVWLMTVGSPLPPK